MSLDILREHPEPITVTADSTLADSEELIMQGMAGGMIYVPSGSSITSLTFYAAHTKGGTYFQIYDADNAAVSRTVAAGRSYSLPEECYGARFLKFVPNADGTVYFTPIG